MSRSCVPVCVALLLPALALAEPAIVRRFEATVHVAPDPASEVIHTLIEDQEVSVSETGEAGYRRVRLPDGTTGWVEEAALAFSAEDAAAAPTAAAEDAAAYPSHAPLREMEPTPRGALIYVKNLGHLSELVESDEVVAPLARDLHQREVSSKVVWWGSLLAGTALLTASLLVPGDNCSTIGGQEYCSFGPTNYGLMIGGVALGTIGPIVGVLMAPKREDLLDVINTWNVRHPDEPFELSSGGTVY
ncbi:MAG TPA: hypothetical protein VK013_18635 [Myxococcaceae bacterium]|nr:hypothetical protein [Myxococcaceae bacterium]